MTHTPEPKAVTLKLTPYQQRKKERDKFICKAWKLLRDNNPEASAWSIAGTISSQCNLTSQGVLNVLIAAGLYKPTPKNRILKKV